MVRNGLILLLLMVVAAPALAQEDVDISKVTPAELLPGDTREALQKAHEAYSEKRYEDAARNFIAVVRANPSDSNSIYNLACCYGLLGMPEQAAAFLEAAYGAGFTDLAHAQRDVDFERVREDQAFVAAMERLTERAELRARAGGDVRTLAVETLCEYRVVVPPGEREPWDRLPLVIGLHGYGDNAENFAGLFVHREMDVPFLYVAIRAPYAFSSGSRGLGYSWGFESERAADGYDSAVLSERLVLTVIEAVKREYRVDERRVYLFGFSQGAGMAFHIGLRNPGLFTRVVPVGGWIDPGEHSPATMERAAKGTRFLICHSPGDRVVPFESAEGAVKFLESHEVPCELVTYEGGHRLPRELMDRILEELDLAPEAPEEVEEPAASPAVGTWTVDKEALKASVLEQLPAEMREAAAPQILQQLEAMNLTMTFAVDGTFGVSGQSGGQTFEAGGTWTLDGEELTITTTTEDGQEKAEPEVKVATLSDGKIRITEEGMPFEMVLIRKAD